MIRVVIVEYNILLSPLYYYPPYITIPIILLSPLYYHPIVENGELPAGGGPSVNTVPTENLSGVVTK